MHTYQGLSSSTEDQDYETQAKYRTNLLQRYRLKWYRYCPSGLMLLPKRWLMTLTCAIVCVFLWTSVYLFSSSSPLPPPHLVQFDMATRSSDFTLDPHHIGRYTFGTPPFVTRPIHEGHQYLEQVLSHINISHSRLVFSISSFPARSEHLPLVLEHLLKNTRIPDRIIILYPRHIARIEQDQVKAAKNTKALFEWLEKSPYKDRITIDQEMPDYGPATKLIGALIHETDPNTLIMIGDDDVLLHDYTLEIAEKTFYDRKEKNLITFNCEEWSRWKSWLSFLGVDEIDYINGGQQQGSRECVGFASAYRGILFKRAWFNEWKDPIAKELQDYSNIPKACKIHDDVYISGMLWRQKGIRPFLVDVNSLKHHYEWNEYAIFKVPGSNPKYRNPCIEFFEYFGKMEILGSDYIPKRFVYKASTPFVHE